MNFYTTAEDWSIVTPDAAREAADTAHRSAYSFALPPELIAQEPGPERDGARLLVLARNSEPLRHHFFRDLPHLLTPGDLLVLNDTRVLAARVLLYRVTGGAVPGLLLEAPATDGFRLLLEGRGRLAVGDRLRVPGSGELVLVASLADGVWRAEVDRAETAAALLATGRMPLPPYIRREKRGADARDALDRARYQTVFARAEGAIAAPTAGLHFTEQVLGQLERRGIEVAYVTLHVGVGTFLPVRADDLREHRMHAERYAIAPAAAAAIERARAERRRVIAVGTTVVRTLEAACDGARVHAGSGETSLFIRPPFDFRVVDAMITNFHLPESTLLMLVAAFHGRERVLEAYRVAIDAGYRFFSYGDAMFLDGCVSRRSS